ncbi:hypothetical protein BDZ89DRAFT_1071439 [Hymenopellis radicata]|nr:hypothetical protein BDZ89DRAFT_1071439 [Hymenopellis radicata]
MLEKYSAHRKRILSIFNQLHAVGAQSDLELPRVVVIGNQSAGKSSVVEAISGINVPRDAGTCTRCPMECRLSSDDDDELWSATVSIRFEYDSKSGRRLREIRELPFGGVIKDKKDVEERLRRAQWAVLHPEAHLSTAMTMTTAELNSESSGFNFKGFSRNVVCVDIKGPELPDLSFVDLPGLIQNAEAPIVKLVEDMVSSYIQGSSLILVTMPMTDDLENQRALKLASSADPKGTRTIGVLTKPDMLGAGSLNSKQRWLDVIEGRLSPLLHGYFCTLQPDDADRESDMSQEVARKVETEFFSSTAPWNASPNASAFGTRNLTNALSGRLIEAIEQSLPNIVEEARTRLHRTSLELNSLPAELTAEPYAHVIGIVSRVTHLVDEYIRGSPVYNTLIQRNLQAYQIFKDAIAESAPVFIPTTESTGAMPSSSSFTMNVLDVRNHNQQCITRELHGNIPFAAKTMLIEKYQGSWKNHASLCAAAVYQNVLNVVLSCTETPDIKRFPELFAFLRSSIVDVVEACFGNARPFVNHEVKRELIPFTQMTENLQSSTEKFLAEFKGVRAASNKGENRAVSLQPSSISQPEPAKPVSSFAFAPTPVMAPATPGSEAQYARRDHWKNFSFGPKTAASTGASSDKFFPFPKTVFERLNAGPLPSSANSPTAAAFEAMLTPPQSLPFGSSPAPVPAGKAASKKGNRAPVATPSASTTNQPLSFSGNATQAAPEASSTPSKPGFSDVSNGFGRRTPFAAPVDPIWNKTSNAGMFIANQAAAGPFTPAKSPNEEEKINQILGNLAELGFTGLVAEDLNKLRPGDEFEEELKVMAEVRGYFQVSFTRLVDTLPSTIDIQFVKAVGRELPSHLIGKLGLGSTEGNKTCAKYLTEDPEVAARREELVARKKRLEKVIQELSQFTHAS